MRKTLLAAAFLMLCGARAHAAQALTVSKLTGGAVTADGKPLKEGQAVPAGKAVRVEKGARLVLDAGPWGKVLIKGPAVFSANKKGGDGLSLKAGGALSVLHKVPGRSFTVRTPAVAAAVRGTTFYAEARGKTASYVCICDGSIELTSGSGAYKSAMSSRKAHKSVLVRFANDQGLSTEATMEHHSDEEIESLGGGMTK